MDCPKCNGECWRDEVDIGVGVVSGPWGCPECGWSADPEYDLSGGPSPAQRARPGWHVDQWGRALRVDAIVERAEHFGIPGDVVRQAFDES